MTDMTIAGLWQSYRRGVMGDLIEDDAMMLSTELGFWSGATAMLRLYHELLRQVRSGALSLDDAARQYRAWMDEIDAHSTEAMRRAGCRPTGRSRV
jgi:hypothetical protein